MDNIETVECEQCEGIGWFTVSACDDEYPIWCDKCEGTGRIVVTKIEELNYPV